MPTCRCVYVHMYACVHGVATNNARKHWPASLPRSQCTYMTITLHTYICIYIYKYIYIYIYTHTHTHTHTAPMATSITHTNAQTCIRINTGLERAATSSVNPAITAPNRHASCSRQRPFTATAHQNRLRLRPISVGSTRNSDGCAQGRVLSAGPRSAVV